jgi:hypothetical protein
MMTISPRWWVGTRICSASRFIDPSKTIDPVRPPSRMAPAKGVVSSAVGMPHGSADDVWRRRRDLGWVSALDDRALLVSADDMEAEIGEISAEPGRSAALEVIRAGVDRNAASERPMGREADGDGDRTHGRSPMWALDILSRSNNR